MATLCLEKNINNGMQNRIVKITIYFMILASDSSRKSVPFFINTVDSLMNNLKLYTSKLCGSPGLKNH